MKKLIFLSFLFAQTTFAVPFKGSQIVITGASREAILWGQNVAERGGNVVDVAVATVLGMSVTSPFFASLGGGGFALVKMNGKMQALDFREVAPLATNEKLFLDKAKEASTNGGLAIGVPGLVKGLSSLHKEYGKRPWGGLFTGPIGLAKKGFRVSGDWVGRTNDNSQRLREPGRAFFVPAKGAVKPGEVLQQPQLVRALELLRDKRDSGFYLGPVAQDIVSSAQKNGGVLSLEDLKNYQVRWRTPEKISFQGFDVSVMPLPSSGAVVLRTMFALADQLNLNKMPPLSVDELHLIAEIENRAFRGRLLLGDPDKNPKPYERLNDSKYLKQLAESISLKRSQNLDPLDEGKFFAKSESNETTHLTVMDKDGNVVTMTFTLNENYGSGVVSEKFGIVLNNEMDDFTTKPGVPNVFGLVQGEANAVSAGKRPVSSMTPTIVEKSGETVLALGAPGGPRIISGVFFALYRNLVTGWDIDRAIQSPRVHQQYRPEKLFVDQGAFSPEILAALKSKGHVIEESWMARVNGISRKGGALEGAYDARSEGFAAGF